MDATLGKPPLISLAYRTATHPPRAQSGGNSSPRAVYHALLPHPAFAPAPDPSDPPSVEAQAQNEALYRQLLARCILAVLLPVEDLRDPCLRALVSDILGDLILGTAIGGRVCAPWFLWENIARAAEGVRAQVEPAASGRAIEEKAKDRLRRLSVASPTKASQSSNRGTVHSEGDKRHEGIASGPRPDQGRPSAMSRMRTSLLAEIFWRALQYLYLAYVGLRFVIEGLVAAAAAPSRDAPARRRGHGGDRLSPTGASSVESAPSAAAAASSSQRRPILAYAVFGLVSQLLQLSERMPWTVGLLALAQHHLVDGALRVGARDGLLDK